MRRLAGALFFLLAVSVVYAQSSPTCPPDVLLAFARSGSACYGLERNQACIGNGTVESQLFATDAQNPVFAKSGDKVDAALLREVHTQIIDKGISTANLYLKADLTDAEEHSMALLLFGDASLGNQVEPLPEITASASGALNIRKTPEVNSDIITSLAVNKAVIANGRTQAGDWLRIHIPNSNDLGWVAANVVKPDSNLLNLAVVDADTPVYRPFQHFKLISGEATLCDGGLGSGLLLQTPNAAAVNIAVNSATMQLSGSFFLQANGALLINVLSGEATIAVNGASQYVPAGASARISLDQDNSVTGAPGSAEPYEVSGLQALPVNNLPFPIQIMAALTPNEIAQKIADHEAIMAEATAEPIAANDTTCHRTTKRDTTLWGGPGLFYEAVNNIDADTSVSPVLQTTDADGKIWWQLRSSNWILVSLVTQSGECDDIPIVVNVPPPDENTLSLETCETINGPLRAGQEVEIQFTPPAWDNYGEARDAVSIDPGRITVGSETYYPYATDPIRLGTNGERYIRRFSIDWTAIPGTFRIVGDRLHYTPICTVTVPVG